MTAEPDALRLVPVKPTAAMIEAFYHAEGPVGPDRIVSWSVATAMARGNVIRHLDDIFANAYRAMLAAAPAVQPAARESVDLQRAIENFMPSAEVAFLWSKETPPAAEVQRYRERYWAVKEALAAPDAGEGEADD